ncbi:tetratricopeptide repeat protein [Candidatus Poribacteria bacterium]|nr:tetratricopeptide repeat protein [Candidatus Poribacteria bacterium]
MKLQLPTIIIVCLSVVLIIIIYVFVGKKTEYTLDSTDESQDFNLIRVDAANSYNSKDYTQAIELYEQAFNLRPENAEVCNDLAAVHYDLGLKFAGPEWPSWPVIRSDGTAAEVLAELNQAYKHVESGYIVVETESQEIVKVVENNVKENGATVYPYRGNKEYTLNILIGSTRDHLEQAKTLYLQAIELKSTYAAPYRNLGSFYVKIGLTDMAINYLQEAYRRDPSDSELAEYLHQQKLNY